MFSPPAVLLLLPVARACTVSLVDTHSACVCACPVSNVSPVSAGYGDMYLLIRNMVAANYDGSIILDHTPSFEEFAGGKYS